jgi:hypothetical protein
MRDDVRLQTRVSTAISEHKWLKNAVDIDVSLARAAAFHCATIDNAQGAACRIVETAAWWR